MIYGRLKIEEAISLKKKCTVAFVDSLPYETQHGLMELIYEDRDRGSARAAWADLIRGHTRALDEMTGCQILGATG